MSSRPEAWAVSPLIIEMSVVPTDTSPKDPSLAARAVRGTRRDTHAITSATMAVIGLTPMSNGTPLAGRTGDSTSLNCNGADPATIQVRIPRIFIQAAPFGSYADTLTVIITPE